MQALADEDFPRRDRASGRSEVQRRARPLDDVHAGGVRARPRGRRAARSGSATSTCRSSAASFLHQGCIAEMRTGEGKTLVATLPSYLNALSGRGVHVVTVNDYLARRDAEWMGRLYRFLRPRPRAASSTASPTAAPGGLPRGHHLRAEQRVRLRLPARQHEVPAAGLRAARAQLRHRRRGGLDPHRRGAHAAHHLRARPRTTTDQYYKVDQVIPAR